MQRSISAQDTLFQVYDDPFYSNFYSRPYPLEEDQTLVLHHSGDFSDRDVRLVTLDKELTIVQEESLDKIEEFDIYSLNQILFEEDKWIYCCYALRNDVPYFITATQSDRNATLVLQDSIQIPLQYISGIQKYKKSQGRYYMFDNFLDENNDNLTNVFIELDTDGHILNFETMNSKILQS